MHSDACICFFVFLFFFNARAAGSKSDGQKSPSDSVFLRMDEIPYIREDRLETDTHTGTISDSMNSCFQTRNGIDHKDPHSLSATDGDVHHFSCLFCTNDFPFFFNE